MSTLYRKYRPQKFTDIFGQEHLVKTITNEIISGKIAHAYLFSGPRGIGKTTMARLLAKSVNCENRKKDNAEPCNQCSSCTEITASRNIDVIEIDAASHTGVDNVRENIIENAKFKPTRSKYKVFIVDEAHMLSTSAFNALLKTLEEPPEYIIFILATTENQKLPATIISRCQRFNFKKIPEKIMLEKLENIAKEEGVKIDKNVLKRIAIKSEGCMRDGESILGQIISLDQKKITPDDVAFILPSADIETVINFIKNIGEKNTHAALSDIDQLIKDGANLEEFTLKIINVLRSIMIAQAGGTINNPDYSEEDIKTIKSLANLFDSKYLINFIDKTIKRKTEIKNSPVPQLPLELLIIEFSSQNNISIDEKKTNLNLINHSPVTTQQQNTTNHNQENEVIITNQTNTINNEVMPDTNILPSNLNQTNQQSVEEKTITDNVQDSVNKSKLLLNNNTIKEYWTGVIKKIAESFPSLTFILQMAEVSVADTNGCVNLFVPYSFHKEKIEESKCKRMVEDAFSNIAGTKIAIKCQVKESLENSTKDNELNNLAQEFGGELIN